MMRTSIHISRQTSFQKTFMLAQMVGARTISQASTRTRQLTTNVGCGAGAGACVARLAGMEDAEYVHAASGPAPCTPLDHAKIS